jgi:peptidoglycan/LPS O-acetylase OafA/YrhL
LTKVGEFSYSLYLIHEMPIKLMYCLARSNGIPEVYQIYFYQGIVFPLCVFIGYVFFNLIEKPLLDRTKRSFS